MKKGTVFIVLAASGLLSLFAFQYLSPLLRMERVTSLATGHLKRMRSELIAFSRTHSVLKGIEQDYLRDPVPECPTNVCSAFDCSTELLPISTECDLCFSRNTVTEAMPQRPGWFLQRDGISLRAMVSSYPMLSKVIGRVDEFWTLEKGGSRLQVCYRLEIGEDIGDIKVPVREILHRNLQALQDELQKKRGWVLTEHWPDNQGGLFLKQP